MKLSGRTLRRILAQVLCVSLITAGMQLPVFAGEISDNSGIISGEGVSLAENAAVSQNAEDIDRAEKAAVSQNEEDMTDAEITVSDNETGMGSSASENEPVSGDDAAVEEELPDTASEDTDTEAAEGSVTATPESDFEWSGNTITKYNGSSSDVVIPKKCVAIANEAFYYYITNKNLTSLSFEEGSLCNSIGREAFASCGLNRVDLPPSLIEIGGKAFSKNNLSSIVLPKKLQKMSYKVFEENPSLRSVTIKTGVLNEVDVDNFSKDKITQIVFDSDVTMVPKNLFESADLSELDLVLPDNITEIGDGAFELSNLKSIKFGNSVTSIGEQAFSGTNLTELELVPSIQTVGAYAFSGIKIKKLTLPATLKKVSECAFSNLSELEELNYNITDLKKWEDSSWPSVFGGMSNLKKLNIGPGVTLIPYCFMNGVSSLGGVELTIPSSVKTIDDLAFRESGLTKVSFEGNRLSYIGYDAFYLCPIAEVKLPSSVKQMQTEAFGKNIAVVKTVVPQKLKILENLTFVDNLSLERVAIHKDTKIDGDPFYGCKKEILVIYGYTGSPAEKYAKSKGYTFKPITEWEGSNPYSENSSGTGRVKVDGKEYNSLKSAFKDMKEEKEYEVVLESDMDGEKNLTIPKKAAKVTIKGNGNTVRIIGTKLTSNTNLILENVTFRAENKKGNPVKFTIDAKKGLAVKDNVAFDNKATIIRTGKELELTGSLEADQINAGSLKLAKTGVLTINKNCKVTVRGLLDSDSGSIKLGDGFNKPITLNGESAGTVKFTGSSLSDGTQVLSAKKNKIGDEALKTVFDVAGITGNTTTSHLYYYKNNKAGIFGDSIRYNNKDYGLWKDALAQMNLDKGSGTDAFIISLSGDVNAAGALKMPKKGYSSLSLEGNGHTITFTGNITLTGDTTVKDLTFRKLNNKGQQVNGKVIKGRYSYTGPETF